MHCRWFVRIACITKKKIHMADTYQITLSNLTDEELRQKRDEIVCMKYKLRIDTDKETPRTKLFEIMSQETGLTAKGIRNIVARAGLATALPRYAASGYKNK